MPVLLEKAPTASTPEQSPESLATPEVQADIDEIRVVEQQIDSSFGLTEGTLESTEATDSFLIESAQHPGASSADLEIALIAGALEATDERPFSDNNPIKVLELGGYGLQITDVVKELHDSHAMLPDGEQAAAVLAMEVDRVISEHGLSGEIATQRRTEGITGIPEFDRLDDYTPEFSEQILMHRSNAELNAGDVVLPSDQITPEMHDELNGQRGFNSTSSPRGSGGYDQKLVHAGTRDFGKVYGKYLYVVEPLEDDTLKWGENFGASVERSRRAESPALEGGKPATTDSHTGKWHNEVVSTKGFRVVEKILHEPEYSEAMLPWPIGPDAVQRHKDRRENGSYAVAHDAGHIVSGFIQTASRKRPGKIGPVDYPGSYRAGADHQIAANLQNKFNVRKQVIQNPGQAALPKMPIGSFFDKGSIRSLEVRPPALIEEQQQDDVLPGMEGYASERPMM